MAQPGYVRVVRAVSPPPGTQNGTTWATAYVDLQDAFTEASNPSNGVTEIWVAAGIYKPTTSTTDRTASFILLPDVRLYGGFNGTETTLAARPSPLTTSILSGDIDGYPADRDNDSLHVVRVEDKGRHWLDGFTIEYGSAIPTSGGGALSTPDEYGGGLLAYDPTGDAPYTHITLRDLIFRNCIAASGGGAFIKGVDRFEASRCTFRDNLGFTRDPDMPTVFGTGGALTLHTIGGTDDIEDDIPEGAYLYHNNFEENASTWGGAVLCFNVRENIWIVNCRFTDNVAVGGGGALFEYEVTNPPSGWPRVEFCTMAYNTALALEDAGNYFGGGAIHVNQQPSGQPPNPSIAVRSSIIWGNTDDGSTGDGSQSIGGSGAVRAGVSYSDIEYTSTNPAWTPGSGMLNTSPLFVSAVTRNLRLTGSSPCIDMADDTVIDWDTLGYGDLLDVDRDGDATEHLPIDLDLTIARELVAVSTTTGVDWAITNVISDMGCYEFELLIPE